MVPILFRVLTLALLGCLSLVGGLSAQEASEGNPLLNMLRFVPDTPENRSFITYGDQVAWRESWGVSPGVSFALVNALPERERGLWLFVMPRQVTPAQTLGLEYLRVDDNQGFYGFDLLTIDRSLYAGQPPEAVTVVDFSFDKSRIAEALTTSGYSSEALSEDAVLYSILDDYQIDIAGKTITTRTGQLGGLNRIALFDGQMIIAKATGIVTTAVQAMQAKIPSLAENPIYQSGALALTDPSIDETGALVGAIMVDAAQLPIGSSAEIIAALVGGRLNEDELKALQAALEEKMTNDPLPQPLLAIFATKRTPGTTYLILALVLPPSSDAQAAADALYNRMTDYTSVMVKRSLTEILAERGAILESAVGVEAGALPVALVVIRNDDPPEDFIPGKTGAEQTGSVPFDWLNMIFARDYLFLAASP